MLSSYRLGDLVLLTLTPEEKNRLLHDYPNSIGSDYLKSPNITEIVLSHIEKHKNRLPNDIEQSTVIHVRLGDVVAGYKEHEMEKRPYSIDHLKSLLVKDTNKRYVIGKCFFAEPSSTNYEQCIYFSNNYLKNVLRELNAEHFDSDNADIDLCCAVKAKLFIQGKGFYSQLIADIRKNLNLETYNPLL